MVEERLVAVMVNVKLTGMLAQQGTANIAFWLRLF